MENKVYNYYGFHCIELIDVCCSILDGYSGFLIGNVIKYVYRAGIKTVDYKQDLLKGLDYLKEFKKLKTSMRIKSICNEKFYKYILLFTNMEHYKNKFFSVLLFALTTEDYKNLDRCINILNEQLYYNNEFEGDNDENTRRNEN